MLGRPIGGTSGRQNKSNWAAVMPTGIFFFFFPDFFTASLLQVAVFFFFFFFFS